MWLQPQDALPGREPLDEAVLHGRRERVFLLLASVFIAGAATLPLLGFTSWFGASRLLREVGLEPSVMLLIPLGAIAFPLALLALNLIGEIYGKHRARFVVLALLVVSLGVLGLRWATDHLADYDGNTTNAFWPGLALVGAGLVTFVVQVELFASIGWRWMRHVMSPMIAVAIGWGAFALAARGLAIPGVPVGDELLGVVLGVGGYASLVVVVGAIAVLPLASTLAAYLRVEPRSRIVGDDDDADELDDADESVEPAFIANKKLYSTGERAFFDAGDRQN